MRKFIKLNIADETQYAPKKEQHDAKFSDEALITNPTLLEIIEISYEEEKDSIYPLLKHYMGNEDLGPDVRERSSGTEFYSEDMMKEIMVRAYILGVVHSIYFDEFSDVEDEDE